VKGVAVRLHGLVVPAQGVIEGMESPDPSQRHICIFVRTPACSIGRRSIPIARGRAIHVTGLGWGPGGCVSRPLVIHQINDLPAAVIRNIALERRCGGGKRSEGKAEAFSAHAAVMTSGYHHGIIRDGRNRREADGLASALDGKRPPPRLTGATVGLPSKPQSNCKVHRRAPQSGCSSPVIDQPL